MSRGRLKAFSPIIAAVVLAAVLAGCGSKKQTGATAVPPVAVELAQVERGSIAQMVRVTGIVRAGTTVQVMAAATGKVKAVYVNVGDKVSQGQVIAELDNAVQMAGLEQAQATLEQARLGLEQAEAALKQVEAQAAMDAANLQRIQTLYNQGAASRQQLDAAELAATVSRENLASARAALEAARARIAAAEAGVRQAQTALDNTYVKAPVAGEVAARLVEPGALAQGPLVILVTSDRLQVEIGVTQEDVNYLKPGEEVKVEIPAVGSKLQGRVASVSPAAEETSRVFKVKIDLPDPPAGVKPGMTATVTYTTRRADDTLLVPKNAVVKRGTQDVVYIVVEGKAAGRVVTTGIAGEEKVEIVKGLAAGDGIIVKGQDFVSEGQPVEVVNGGAKE